MKIDAREMKAEARKFQAQVQAFHIAFPSLITEVLPEVLMKTVNRTTNDQSVYLMHHNKLADARLNSRYEKSDGVPPK